MSSTPESASNQPPRKSLLRASMTTGAMTLLSRILGLARDQVLAHVLGASGSAGAFILAFKIPNFFRRLFSEGAFSQAFVPVLSEYRTQGSHAAVQVLVNRVAGCLGFILCLVSLVGVIGAPVVGMIFAPGFTQNPEQFSLLVDLIRITFPYLLLISLTGFAGAILNSYDRFAIPAFTPVLLNICMIASALFAAPYFSDPSYALAWGVLLAGVLSLMFQLPFLQRIHLLPRPQINWRDPGVKKILALMVPALFGVSITQFNLLLDSSIASFLPDGSIGWLYYSDRLVELPLGIFAVAIATVIMPSLSRQHSAASPEHFSHTLDWAIRLILLTALPATLALVILAEPIILTLFQHGKLTVYDALMSSYSLRVYALGLLGFMLIKVLAPGYFSRQDMKTPMRIGMISIAANIVMKLLLVAPLYAYFALGHVGLALSTALAAYVNAYLLYRGLRRAGVYNPDAAWWTRLLRYGAANIVMALVLFGFLQHWDAWQTWSLLERAGHLVIICILGGLSYLISLLLVGVRLQEFRPQS